MKLIFVQRPLLLCATVRARGSRHKEAISSRPRRSSRSKVVIALHLPLVNQTEDLTDSNDGLRRLLRPPNALEALLNTTHI